MSGGYVVSTSLKSKTFTANLSQAAATYDLCTATGGDVFIKNISVFSGVAAGGLTSVSISTNNTTADTVLASTLLAVLTGGKNLTPLTTITLLASTKKIQYTIVGTGNAGTLLVTIEYYQGAGDLV